MPTMTIRDQASKGAVVSSARELIRRRVAREVRDHNAGLALGRVGPVPPESIERRLSGGLAYEQRYWLDWEAECARALRAFVSGRLSLLVDRRRVTDPDAEIEIGPEPAIAFVWAAPQVVSADERDPAASPR